MLGTIRHFRPQGGFSLLGVLIAGFLLALVGGAIVGLAFRTGGATSLTEQRLVATYLAREGVELVRAIRDHNFLAADRCPPVGACTVPFYWRGGSPLGGTIELCNGTDQRIDTRSLVLLESGDSLLYRSGTASTTYTHDSTGLSTPFRRTVEIQTPPDNSQGCDGTSKYTPANDGDDPPQPIWVIVRVAWTTRDGSAREVEVGEELYPWMRGR